MQATLHPCNTQTFLQAHSTKLVYMFGALEFGHFYQEGSIAYVGMFRRVQNGTLYISTCYRSRYMITTPERCKAIRDKILFVILLLKLLPEFG